MFKCGWLAGGINISENPSRSVMPCCHVDKLDPKNHVLIHNGKDLINGDTLKQMRKDAVNGITPELCKMCVSKEKLGIDTPRLRSIREFNNKGIVKEVFDPSDVEALYIKFSNLCNFKCVMCGAGSSHLIAKEQNWSTPLSEINDFYETQLLDLLPQMTNLRHVQITGGEPLLHKKKNLDFLSKLSKDVKIQYRTNGSIYDNEVTDFLKTFDTVHFLTSIDGQEDVLHYQRPRSEWNVIEENLKQYKDKGFTIINTMTVTSFNIHQIPKFINEQGYLFDYMVYTPVRFPEEYRVNLIQPSKLEQIVEELKQAEDPEQGDLKNIIKDIEENYMYTPSDKIIEKFWTQAEYMKQHRGVDLETLISEMYAHYIR